MSNIDEKWLWGIHTLDDNLFLKSNVMLSKTRAGLDSRFAQRFCPCYNISYIQTPAGQKGSLL